MTKIFNENDAYVVRSDRAGVFFGHIKGVGGQVVTMTNARRLYVWSGATDINQLSAEGVKFPNNCKFTMCVEEITLLDAIEIQRCTQQATDSLTGVEVWKI